MSQNPLTGVQGKALETKEISNFGIFTLLLDIDLTNIVSIPETPSDINENKRKKRQSMLDNTEICLIAKASTTTDKTLRIEVEETECTKPKLITNFCEAFIPNADNVLVNSTTETSKIQDQTKTTLTPIAITTTSKSTTIGSSQDHFVSSESCKSKLERSNADKITLPPVDLFLSPARKEELLAYLKQAKEEYIKIFDSLDYEVSYENIFELLWYNGNPCFDISNYTSDYPDHKALIKECLWKGKSINCSSLFRMTPTDNGMCCTLSLKKSLYVPDRYSNSILKLQQQDRINAFDSGVGVNSPELGKPFKQK